MTARPRMLAAGPAAAGIQAAVLGEGPYWDVVSETLYWVDIPAGLVHRRDASGADATWQVGQPVSAVVARASGGLVLAARDGVLHLDPATGALTLLAAVEADRPGNRMNDAACDRAGRLFVGTKAENDAPGAGALYRLDTDRRLSTVLTGVSISNGIGWSPDEQLMYYVDSPTCRIDMLDYDPASGAVASRRPFADVTRGDGVPDGLTVDADGGVWVAVWDGGAVLGFDPRGELTTVITVPAARPTSCVFGGPELDVLYITTAARPAPADLGGNLFACRPGPGGQQGNPYRG